MTPLPLTSLPVTWQLTALSLGVGFVYEIATPRESNDPLGLAEKLAKMPRITVESADTMRVFSCTLTLPIKRGGIPL